MRPECVGYVDDVNDPNSTISSQQKALTSQEHPSMHPNLIAAPIIPFNRVDTCDESFVSDDPCQYVEGNANKCFEYKDEHPCFGTQNRYCRPVYPTDMQCDVTLACKEGDMETTSCWSEETDCYTVSNCAGVLFCANAQ